MADSIKHITQGYGWEKSTIGELTTKSTDVMKVSVMTLSPKHLAHILFGGIFFIMAGGGIDEIRSAFRAIKIVKAGEMDKGLSHTMYGPDENILHNAKDHQKVIATLKEAGQPRKAFQYAGGRTLARVWQSLGNQVDQIRKFEDFIGNTQRTMAFLGEENRALRKGFSPEAAKNMGLRHAERMLVDF